MHLQGVTEDPTPGEGVIKVDMRGRHKLAAETVTRGIALTACALRRAQPRDIFDSIGLNYDAIKKDGCLIPEHMPDSYDSITESTKTINLQKGTANLIKKSYGLLLCLNTQLIEQLDT